MELIINKVLAGDVRTVARIIRDIDDNIPGVRDVLKELYPHTGKAYVIGITGSPGVGKSTLVAQMIKHLRDMNKTVGVIAVDPTSPFSGGAILGDRIRMQNVAVDDGVFIRSMATRGHFGGLTRSTRSVIDVLDAMGKDYIIVETVGVGQDEVEVVKSAHSTVIVVMPGMGDDIQAIKAGILEIGDIFVINKADKEGSDQTASYLRSMIELDPRRHSSASWEPPILKAQAAFNKGIKELLETVDKHRAYLIGKLGGLNTRMEKSKVYDELAELVKTRIMDDIVGRITRTGEFDRAVEAIIKGETDPYSACDSLVIAK